MRLSDERGAILIHTLLALVMLVMFSAAVIDYGAMMVSRNQSQNAADAAALAGAVALAFDHPAGDRWDRARNVAWEAGNAHKVWSQPPVVVPTSPYTGAPCASFPERCVRVDVFRNGEQGSSPVGTLVAGLFGVPTQGVKAMAVAETAPASGSECLKPWLIPDRWDERGGNPDKFDPMWDVYVAPTTDNPGTGWQPTDIGQELTLKAGHPSQAISPSDFYEIETAQDYEEAITGCEITKRIGETADALPGNRVGPTNSGVDDLLAANPDGAIVMIGMFSPAEFEGMRRQSGNFTLHITNILAFKITERRGNEVRGTIVGAPSEMVTTCSGPACPTSSGLVSVIRLRR